MSYKTEGCCLRLVLVIRGAACQRRSTMKKLLTLILSVAVLATLGGLVTVKAAKTVNGSRSNGSDRAGTPTPTPKPTPKPGKPKPKPTATPTPKPKK